MTCPRCDHLATEVMRLREDRNEWRRMYIMLRRLVNALVEVHAARPASRLVLRLGADRGERKSPEPL